MIDDSLTCTVNGERCHQICGLQRKTFNSGTKRHSSSHPVVCVVEIFIKVKGIEKASDIAIRTG